MWLYILKSVYYNQNNNSDAELGSTCLNTQRQWRLLQHWAPSKHIRAKRGPHYQSYVTLLLNTHSSSSKLLMKCTKQWFNIVRNNSASCYRPHTMNILWVSPLLSSLTSECSVNVLHRSDSVDPAYCVLCHQSSPQIRDSLLRHHYPTSRICLVCIGIQDKTLSYSLLTILHNFTYIYAFISVFLQEALQKSPQILYMHSPLKICNRHRVTITKQENHKSWFFYYRCCLITAYPSSLQSDVTVRL